MNVCLSDWGYREAIGNIRCHSAPWIQVFYASSSLSMLINQISSSGALLLRTSLGDERGWPYVLGIEGNWIDLIRKCSLQEIIRLRGLSFFPALQVGIHSSRGSQQGAQTISHSHWTPAGQAETLGFWSTCPTIRAHFIWHHQWLQKNRNANQKKPILAIRLRAQSNFIWCRELSNEFRCLPGQTVLGRWLDWIAVWDPGQNGFQPILIIALQVVNWGSLFSIYKL